MEITQWQKGEKIQVELNRLYNHRKIFMDTMSLYAIFHIEEGNEDNPDSSLRKPKGRSYPPMPSQPNKPPKFDAHELEWITPIGEDLHLYIEFLGGKEEMFNIYKYRLDSKIAQLEREFKEL